MIKLEIKDIVEYLKYKGRTFSNEEVASAVNLEKDDLRLIKEKVKFLLKNRKRDLPAPKVKLPTKLEKVASSIDNVVFMAKNGYSQKEIAKIFEVSAGCVSQSLRENKYSFQALRKQGLIEHLTAVEQGKEHLFKVREKFGFKPTSFYTTLVDLGKRDLFNQERPLSRFYRHDLEQSLQDEENKEINSMILTGKKLSEIAESQGVKRQHVDMYIRGSGLHPLWKEAREEAKRKKDQTDLKEQRSALLKTLRDYVKDRIMVSEGDSIGTKTEKTLARRILDTSNKGGFKFKDYDRVTALFREYFLAQESGEKLTFAQLSKKTGYAHLQTARYHLNKAGLSSMLWKSKRLTEEEKKLIERGAKTCFSLRDLKYFGGLNCSFSSIGNYTPKRKSASFLPPVAVSKKGYLGAVQRLSYSDIGQIYEALDRGFKIKELPILFPDFLPESIDKAIKERKTHEPEIVRGLRKLYPRKDIRNPYTNLGGSFK